MKKCKNPPCNNDTLDGRVYCSLSCRSTYTNSLRGDKLNNKITNAIRKSKKKQKENNINKYNKNPTKCKNCNSKLPYKKRNNKFCDVACSNEHRTVPNTHKNKSSKSIAEYYKNKYLKDPKKCIICDSNLSYEKRKRSTCSQKCLNELKKENYNFINSIGDGGHSKALKQYYNKPCTCIICNEIMDYNNRHRKTCSDECLHISSVQSGKKGGLIGGKKSAQVQSEERRSKNEKLFAKKCIKHFDKVLTNEPIFNGWDADIIIEDHKIAVLWNGIWHYEKITEKHSVKQVQNRDKIKIKEIKNMNYTPYIIKDMGKFSKNKVNSEFNKFTSYVNSKF